MTCQLKLHLEHHDGVLCGERRFQRSTANELAMNTLSACQRCFNIMWERRLSQ